MFKLSYTYSEIVKIRDDLRRLVDVLSKTPNVDSEVRILSENVKKELYSYDALLNSISPDGCVTDAKTCEGLYVTQEYIKKIFYNL